MRRHATELDPHADGRDRQTQPRWSRETGPSYAHNATYGSRMSAAEFRGVYVPIITPFADDGTVATEALERLAGRLIDDGAAGLVALGTAGEGPLLDDGERQAVLEVCARVCSDRGAQLIVGAGSNSTSHTMAAVRALDGTIGLTAVLCLVPYYLRPTQAGIRAHFEAVADASPVPVVIYNIPFRTGIRPSLETLLALAALEGVAGLKHSVGALDEDTQQLLAAAPEDFAILGGDDQHLAALVLLGGSGGITASAHLVTSRWVALADAALDGRVEEAREHQSALLPVAEAGFAEPSPAVFKGVLHRRGEIPTPDVRLPFLPAVAESIDRAEVAAAACG